MEVAELGDVTPAFVRAIFSGRIVHSRHGYFMRAGDVRGLIVYQIDRSLA